jgi:glycosyltransferase involved in cell wall biosynthesis
VANICALNNYPLRKMWELAERGSVPRQHLWGVDALAAAGHAVAIAPFHEPVERDPLDIISARSRRLLGHLDQEAYAMRRMAAVDVLYCADQTGLAGLALARSLLPAARLVSVVHHPVRTTVRRLAASRHDLLVCLSEALAAELRRELPRRRADIVHLPWGPDLRCPLYRPQGESHGVVSAGKSNRDLRTLTRALQISGAPGLVYDLGREVPAPPNEHVRLIRPGDIDGVDPDAPSQYLATRALEDIAAAAVVAVPIRDPGRLTGLTEVADAIALGKPVIASRSPYFPFDIEAIGCGIWVESEDPCGWARAIAELISDDGARLEMGSAGRRFAERHWNYERFCEGLNGLITRLPDHR